MILHSEPYIVHHCALPGPSGQPFKIWVVPGGPTSCVCEAPLIPDQSPVQGHAGAWCPVCSQPIGWCGAAYVAAGIERAEEHAQVGERPPQ